MLPTRKSPLSPWETVPSISSPTVPSLSLPTLSLSTWLAQSNNNSNNQKNQEEEDEKKRIEDANKKIEELAAQIGHQVGSDQLRWTQWPAEESDAVNSELRDFTQVGQFSVVEESSEQQMRYGATSFGSSRRSSPSNKMLEETRFKTNICRNIMDRGYCSYGDHCQFAHGTDEMRRLEQDSKYKTKRCQRYWSSVGGCPYGPRCKFLHYEDQSQSELRSYSRAPGGEVSPRMRMKS